MKMQIDEMTWHLIYFRMSIALCYLVYSLFLLYIQEFQNSDG
jgi:hypothetical protein